MYFIVKGAVKWESSEAVAKTGGFIGNIKGYYEHEAVNHCIEVLKDTWVVEIPMRLFGG